MSKGILPILFFIVMLNEVSQSVPNTTVLASSSRFHRGAARLYHHVNPIVDVRSIPSDNFIPRFRHKIIQRREQENDEPETIFIDLNVNADEEMETKYVHLFIDTT